MSGQYILDAEGKPVEELDILAWGKWMQEGDRRVARDELPDSVSVSTVFLGLDHSFGSGPPILWETMIFDGPHDMYQDRYSSREEALAGHAKAVAIAKGEVKP